MRFMFFGKRGVAEAASTKLNLDRLAYAGDWELFDSPQQLSAARRGTGMRDWTIAVGGTMLGRFGREPRGERAAAAILAGLKDDAVAVEAVGGGFWVCAVRAGMPLPGEDRLVDSKDAAVAHASAFLRIVPSAVQVGLLEGASTTLEHLLSEIPTEVASRSLLVQWRWRFVRLSAVVLAVVLLLAGAVVLQRYLETQADETVTTAPPHVVPPVQAPVSQPALVSAAPVVRSFAPLNGVEMLKGAVAEVDAWVSGYEPTSVTCSLSAGVCDINWQGYLEATAEGAALIPGLVSTPRELIGGMPVLSRVNTPAVEPEPVEPSHESAVLTMKAFFQRARQSNLPIDATIRAAGPDSYVVAVRASYAYAADVAKVVQAARGYIRTIRLEGVQTNQPMIVFDADVSMAVAHAPSVDVGPGSAAAVASGPVARGAQ